MNTTLKVFTIFCFACIISCDSSENKNQSDNEGTVEVATLNENMEEDRDYLVSAHINSQLQVSLGKIANEQSQSPELQQFGQQITLENQQIQENINALATAAEIEMNPALTPEYVAVIDFVQSLSGREFDEAFLDLVIEEHNEDIERFTTLSTRMDNPIVRDMITDNLEILTRRKNQAEELKNSLD